MQKTFVPSNERIAEMLCHCQKLPSDKVKGMVERAEKQQEWIGKLAVKEGFITYEDLAMVLSRETNIPLVNLYCLSPEPEAMQLLPESICRAHSVVPLALQHGTLVLAVANPLDKASLEKLKVVADSELELKIAPLNAILHMAGEWYSHIPSLSPANEKTDLQDLLADFHPLNFTESNGSRIGDGAEPFILHALLQQMKQQSASDLHLATGSPPKLRINGKLHSMPMPKLTAKSIQSNIYAILTDRQVIDFERSRELDFSYSLQGVSRFRINLHRQRNSLGAVIRIIPMEVPTLHKLHMPPIIREFTRKPRGLVLITGPTGSGKSTTLAAMIDEINRSEPMHIVTIEDPIEFLHNNYLSVVTQREVGPDTDSFATALRHVLRQDPDVILIGELRDLETVSAALTAAETGHLVLATLHTTSASQTIDRLDRYLSGNATGAGALATVQCPGRGDLADAVATSRWQRTDLCPGNSGGDAGNPYTHPRK